MYREFESHLLLHIYVQVAEWLKAADCKSADIVYVGSNPTLCTIILFPSKSVGRLTNC